MYILSVPTDASRLFVRFASAVRAWVLVGCERSCLERGNLLRKMRDDTSLHLGRFELEFDSPVTDSSHDVCGLGLRSPGSNV